MELQAKATVTMPVKYFVCLFFSRAWARQIRQQDSFIWGAYKVRTQHVALPLLYSSSQSERPNRIHWSRKLRGSDDWGELDFAWFSKQTGDTFSCDMAVFCFSYGECPSVQWRKPFNAFAMVHDKSLIQGMMKVWRQNSWLVPGPCILKFSVGISSM